MGQQTESRPPSCHQWSSVVSAGHPNEHNLRSIDRGLGCVSCVSYPSTSVICSYIAVTFTAIQSVASLRKIAEPAILSPMEADAPPLSVVPPSPAAKMLDFLLLVGKLKHVKRTGWVLRNVSDPECVAGHMHRMAVITLLLSKPNNSLDLERCMKLALIHDLAECIVGDITPHCGIEPDEKHQREDKAMQTLCDLAGDSGPDLYSLYKEYEAKDTPEAKFVKELDCFDMILEAYSYEKAENRPGRLQEFFDSTKDKFSHPLIVSLVSELDTQRHKFAVQDCGDTAHNVQ